MAQQKTEWILELKDLMSRKLDGVDAEVVKLQKDFKKLVDEIEDPDTSGIDDIKKTTQASSEAMAEAQGAVLEFFGAMASGNAVAASNSLKSLQANFVGLRAAAMSFIATPVGATITALAAIGLATKEWIQFNEEAREANRQVKSITNAADSELSGLRVRAQALADTFGGDWQEHLRNANSLQKGFEISSKQAFDTYTNGLVRGGNLNEEFQQSIREYPKLFKQAGISAQEFVNMIDESANQSVFSDKIVDAVKEANISLQEQTPATRAALESAFGKTFTEDLFNNVRSGAYTTRDALKTISEEAKEVTLDQQQQAQLTADIFRSAGEDAGGFAQVIDIVNRSLSNQQQPLSDVEAAVAKVAEQNERLRESQAKALESDSYKVLAQQASSAWKEIQIFFYDYINAWNEALNFTQVQAQGAFSGIKAYYKSVTSDVSGFFKDTYQDFKDIVKQIIDVGSIWDAFKSDGIGAAGKAAKEWWNGVKEESDEAAQNIKNDNPVSKAIKESQQAYFDGILAATKNQKDLVNQYNAEEDLLTPAKQDNGGSPVKVTNNDGVLGLNSSGSSGRIINMNLDIKNIFQVADSKRADVTRMADEIIGVVVDKLRDSAIAIG